MLNVLTLGWGILAICGFFLGLIPRLAGLHWLNIAFAVSGAVVGIVAIVSARNGASKGGLTGLVLCLIASLFEMIRLVLGHDVS